jgi:hypothetical protein
VEKHGAWSRSSTYNYFICCVVERQNNNNDDLYLITCVCRTMANGFFSRHPYEYHGKLCSKEGNGRNGRNGETELLRDETAERKRV